MHFPLMNYAGFNTELQPNSDGIGNWGGNVMRHIGLFVAEAFVPTVLVFLTDIFARRIVMVLAHVKAIYAAIRTGV